MTQGVIPPPSPSLPVQIQGISAYGPAGNATSIPTAIAVLPTGTLLRGLTSGRNPQGQIILKTEKGDLALKTDIFFKRGVELTLRIEKAQSETLARIISVDGKSLAKYVESMSHQLPEEDSIVQNSFTRQQAPLPPAPTNTSSTGTTSAAPQQQATPFGSAAVSARMTAILLTALPEGEALEALPAPIVTLLQNAPAGTQLAVKITQLQMPESLITPQPTATPAAAPTGTATITTPSSPLPPTVASPATAPAPVPLQSTVLPTEIAPPLPPAANPVTTTATVTTPPAITTATSPETPVIPAALYAAEVSTPAPSTAGAKLPVPPLPGTIPPPAATPSPSVPTSTPVTVTTVPAPAVPSPESPVPTTATTAAMSTAPSSPATPVAPPQTASVAVTATPQPTVTSPATTAPAATAATAATAVATATPTLTATVLEGSTATGLTLSSPIGMIRLLSPTPLPPGTQVQFQVEYFQAPTQPTFPGTPAPTAAHPQEVLKELASLPMPAGAGGFPVIGAGAPYQPHLLPHPGKELTTELVFLMSALKGGDLRKWLGDETMKRLEDSKADLLKQISAEFATMRRNVGEEGDPVRGTLYHLPFATAAGVEPIRIFHRDNGNKSKAEPEQKGESGEHFLVDIHFTRIGTLQLDGFVKKGREQKSFDLIIRSENPLEDELKQGIREIFQGASELSGMNGALSFREGRDSLYQLPGDTPPLEPQGGHQSLVV